MKLSFHCGTNPGAMLLSLLDEGGALMANMWEDGRKLGFYSPRDGCTLHVTDTGEAGGGEERGAGRVDRGVCVLLGRGGDVAWGGGNVGGWGGKSGEGGGTVRRLVSEVVG